MTTCVLLFMSRALLTHTDPPLDTPVTECSHVTGRVT